MKRNGHFDVVSRPREAARADKTPWQPLAGILTVERVSALIGGLSRPNRGAPSGFSSRPGTRKRLNPHRKPGIFKSRASIRSRPALPARRAVGQLLIPRLLRKEMHSTCPTSSRFKPKSTIQLHSQQPASACTCLLRPTALLNSSAAKPRALSSNFLAGSTRRYRHPHRHHPLRQLRRGLG